MSLTAARGPLGADPAGWFSAPVPRAVVYLEPHPRRVQAWRRGDLVLDTERALLVHRAGAPLSYAFPSDEVGDLPTEPEPEATGYLHVPWDAVDEWREEGRLLVDYPPNPYHRVDCRPTSRRLRVAAGAQQLVDTDETVIVFETALPPRLYVDRSHVRSGLLRRSDTTTYCNYKGVATYWSVTAGGREIADAAWSYEDPLPESLPIRALVSFDLGKLKVQADLPL